MNIQSDKTKKLVGQIDQPYRLIDSKYTVLPFGISTKSVTNMNIVCYTNLDDFNLNKYKSIVGMLPDFEIERLNRLRRPKDRLLSAAGKMLLLQCLRIVRDTDIAKFPELKYNCFGRPNLINSSCDFNISHSGEVVVCAFTSNGRVGIDIELIKNINIYDYNLVLRDDELQSIITSSDPRKHFYQYWTSKESILKANGTGFSLDPLEIVINNNESVIANKNWYLTPLEIGNNYVCTLATEIPLPPFLRSL